VDAELLGLRGATLERVHVLNKTRMVEANRPTRCRILAGK
jgi:hypothetical protein